MFAACSPLFPQCDIFISVAAVCDYKPRVTATEKTKKTAAAAQPEAMSSQLRETPESRVPSPQSPGTTLDLVPTIDILKTLASKKTPSQIIVGFAAETHNLETYARQKLQEKNLDWIIANNVATPGIGMNSPDNAILMLSRTGARHAYGPAPKPPVAHFILSHIA
jgi:phosphopantothenoylcysteine decarboxylase/phosphopantothenate--cysteine ligase